jgi:hypothetical protein
VKPLHLEVMPDYFIQVGEGPHDYVLNFAKFDFYSFAKDQINWFQDRDDPEVIGLPKISATEANFDLFSLKVLRLLKNYAIELKQFFPHGMSSHNRNYFCAVLASKFNELEIKYQGLKTLQRSGIFIGAKAKQDSLKWPSVIVSYCIIIFIINWLIFYRAS